MPFPVLLKTEPSNRLVLEFWKLKLFLSPFSVLFRLGCDMLVEYTILKGYLWGNL